MQKFLKLSGFLVASFGLLVLVGGSKNDVVGAIVFTLIGTGIVIYCQFSVGISKKSARKELMELKSLLDSGVLNESEYEEKARALKDKI